MSSDRKMPPGPSRRGDMLTEEEQRKLRRSQGKMEGESGQATRQAEGKSSTEGGKTSGKSKGDRQKPERRE